MRIIRFIGIYDADGTLWGELKYAWKKLSTDSSCSLCDITHKGWGENPQWRDCQSQLPIPFEFYHLDDQPKEVATASDGQTPCIIAETESGYEVIMKDEELRPLAGKPQTLVEQLKKHLAESSK